MMSIHAKRAAVAVALFLVFTVVHLAWPFLSAFFAGSGALGAFLVDPLEIAAEAFIAWGLTYWLSTLWSRRAAAKR